MTKESLILDGKKVANDLKHCLKNKINQISQKVGKRPKLAVILVGDNNASKVYIAHKEKAAKELGIESDTHYLPANTKQEDLNNLIKILNEDENINGILLQLPLPATLSPDIAILQINPLKDIDGLHPFNLGLIMTGKPNLIPCTPFGIMRLLQAYHFNPKGLKATVIGRSRLVGKPIAELLINASATVTIMHSKSRLADLIESVKQADLVIAAIGQPAFVKADWIKENAILIDVGINRLENGKLIGDIDFEACVNEGKAKAITPVPGGVGPLTVAHLMLNTVKAFEIQCFGYSSIEL